MIFVIYIVNLHGCASLDSETGQVDDSLPTE